MRSRNPKDGQWNDQKKKTEGRIMSYKTLHRKLNIGQHEPTIKWGLTQVLRKGSSSSCSTSGTRLRFLFMILYSCIFQNLSKHFRLKIHRTNWYVYLILCLQISIKTFWLSMFFDLPCKYICSLKSKNKNRSLGNIVNKVVVHEWLYIPLELYYECVIL
jgi:hypothetical protein